MAGPLSFCFSIGVPSEVAAALLLVSYGLLVVTTAGAASSSVLHLVSKLEDCLVLEVTIFDFLRSKEWPFIRSTTSVVAFGAGVVTTSGAASSSVVLLGSRSKSVWY